VCLVERSGEFARKGGRNSGRGRLHSGCFLWRPPGSSGAGVVVVPRWVGDGSAARRLKGGGAMVVNKPLLGGVPELGRTPVGDWISDCKWI